MAIPLYYQLETILRKKIMSGDFSPEIPMPSEDALARGYKVSRITVRQALSALEKDGLLIRQPGRGTFISEKADSLELPRFTGSIEDLVLMGKRTEIRVIDSTWVNPPGHIRDHLSVKDEQVLRIEKVRNIEGKPFSHVFNYLPPHIGKKLSMDLVKSKPMLMILEDDLGVRAIEADQTVEATIADPEVASLLEIRVGDPLLKTERTVYDDKHNPVEYVTVMYRADKYAYTMKLKRKKTDNSRGWGAV